MLGVTSVSPLPAAWTVMGISDQRSADAQLKEILERPLFQRWQLRQQRAKSAPKDLSLLKSAKDLLREMFGSIGKFFRNVFGKIRWPQPPNFSGGSGLMAILKVLIWTGGAALLIYLMVILYRIYMQRTRRIPNARILSREEIRSALEQGDALALDGAAWLNEAQHLAEAGKFRAVYRALYLALLSGLHQHGRIEYRRQRTNWTYVSRFRGNDEDRSIFSELTQLFDEVWYGLKTVRHHDIEELRTKVSTLVGTESGVGVEVPVAKKVPFDGDVADV